MNAQFPCLLHDLPLHRLSGHILPPPPPVHPQNMDWRSLPPPPPPQHTALFAGALAPSSWTNAAPSHPHSLWHAGPPDFLLPFHHHHPSKHCEDGPRYSLARSDTSSAVSRNSDLSPSPEIAEVVCNAPLVAPIPLPYHSPTFLLYDLPDDDEDLSHPPYTHRPHKRKRAQAQDDDDHQSDEQPDPNPPKRRSIPADSHSRRCQWSSTAQWGTTSAALTTTPATTHALRHPPAGFPRRNRVR